jgi:hypothetical protein
MALCSRGGAAISGSPKLVIKLSGYKTLDVCELEQARDHLNFKSGIILVDGKRIRSYEELVQLITHENYAKKEFIEVVLLPLMTGG